MLQKIPAPVLILGIIVFLLVAVMGANYYLDTDFLAGSPSVEREVYIVRDVFIDLNQDGHPDLLLYGEVILDEGGTIELAK